MRDVPGLARRRLTQAEEPLLGAASRTQSAGVAQQRIPAH